MFWYLLIAAAVGGAIGFGITYVVCRFLPQEEIRQLNEARLREEEACLFKLREQQDQVRYEIDKLWEERSNIFTQVAEMRVDA